MTESVLTRKYTVRKCPYSGIFYAVSYSIEHLRAAASVFSMVKNYESYKLKAQRNL